MDREHVVEAGAELNFALERDPACMRGVLKHSILHSEMA
jgi:hypothetical protein